MPTFSTLDLLSVACECDLPILIVPVELIRLGAKVFDDITQCPRCDSPVVSRSHLVESRMQDFSGFVE